MDISTAISGDPCSEKLLPVGSTEILIQGESGDVYGNGPKKLYFGWIGFPWCSSCMLCQLKGHDLGGCWCGDVEEAAGVVWAWEARGQTNAT